MTSEPYNNQSPSPRAKNLSTDSFQKTKTLYPSRLLAEDVKRALYGRTRSLLCQRSSLKSETISSVENLYRKGN